MFFLDPMPTPAGRAGRTSVWVGLAAWALLAVGAYFFNDSFAYDDARIAGGVERVGRTFITLGVCTLLIGMGFVAAGFVRRMLMAPDLGMRWVIAGLVVNALPMVGVALYVGGQMVMAKLKR